jgi:hypothetical protein
MSDKNDQRQETASARQQGRLQMWRARWFGERDAVADQLADIARQGSGMARLAHVCASPMLVLFSAGSLVALGGDALLSVPDGAQHGHVDPPAAISLGVSTLLVLCMDVAMLYAASMLRLLGMRRAEPRSMRLHRGVMATVAILEAGTYAYMAWRYETPPQYRRLGARPFPCAHGAAPLGLSCHGAAASSNGQRHLGAGGAGEWVRTDPRCRHDRQRCFCLALAEGGPLRRLRAHDTARSRAARWSACGGGSTARSTGDSFVATWCRCRPSDGGGHGQRPFRAQRPSSQQPERRKQLTVALMSGIGPDTQGRTWSEEHYAARDARLAALGVQLGHRRPRLR